MNDTQTPQPPAAGMVEQDEFRHGLEIAACEAENLAATWLEMAHKMGAANCPDPDYLRKSAAGTAIASSIRQRITQSRAPTPAEGERDSFERYARTKGWPTARIYQSHCLGDYEDVGVQRHWITWQQARATPSAAEDDRTTQSRLLEIGAAISDLEEAAKDYEHILTKDGETAYARSSRERMLKCKQRLHRLVADLAAAPASPSLTQEQANARLSECRNDKEWTRRYFAGDKETIAEYDRLVAIVAGRCP